MKARFKRLNWLQWFLVLCSGLATSGILQFEEFSLAGWSWVFPIKLGLGIVIWFLFAQWMMESNFIPVSLEMKLALAKPANQADERLFEELERDFKAHLKKGAPVCYKGFDLDDVTAWFHFTGMDTEAIQSEVKRVLGERPLPADAHFVIRTDWTTNEERRLPLYA